MLRSRETKFNLIRRQKVVKLGFAETSGRAPPQRNKIRQKRNNFSQTKNTARRNFTTNLVGSGPLFMWIVN
jgi:hypothetical protein